jgi:hypothetical protein
MGAVTPTSCPAWRGRLAMWAVGGLEPDEAHLVGEHLAVCAACREEADELAGVTRLLSTVDLSSVDPSVTTGSDRDAVSTTTATPVVEPLRGTGSGAGSRGERAVRRAAVAVGTVAATVALVASVVSAAAGSVAAPPGRSVTLHGANGVRATVALTAEPWGARAVLDEVGQPAGTTYTVSMESSPGYRWVAGSYRTGSGSGPMEVQLTCPVSPGQITGVWITDPSGRTVLDGYA